MAGENHMATMLNVMADKSTQSVVSNYLIVWMTISRLVPPHDRRQPNGELANLSPRHSINNISRLSSALNTLREHITSNISREMDTAFKTSWQQADVDTRRSKKCRSAADSIRLVDFAPLPLLVRSRHTSLIVASNHRFTRSRQNKRSDLVEHAPVALSRDVGQAAHLQCTSLF